MEMAYRERWRAEIAELQRILSGFDLREERKWGKPCYTMDGKNVVIIQGFKEYCALGFFQGALLKDPKKLLVQLGQVQAARVMKFTSAKEIAAKAATIKAYVREAVAAAKAGLKVETKPPELPVPEELKEKFRNDPRFKRAFEALTPVGICVRNVAQSPPLSAPMRAIQSRIAGCFNDWKPAWCSRIRLTTFRFPVTSNRGRGKAYRSFAMAVREQTSAELA